MKKSVRFRHLTALVFLAFVGMFFLLSLRPFLRESYYALRSGHGPNRIEERYGECLPGRTGWITLNGGLQRLLGRREVNERYRLDNGQLSYVIPPEDVSGIADRTLAFFRALDGKGIPALYVNTLFKTDPLDKQLPLSVEDQSNENADRFLALLREGGADAVDLREAEREDWPDHYALFFPTDHHWRPRVGLWAAQKVAEALAERDPSFAVDPELLNPEKYEMTVEKGIFLGSHGRRVGPWYAGMDDLELLTPGFETLLRLSVPSQGILKEGSYQETMLFPEKLTEGGLLESSRYDVYCGGEYDLMRVENLSGGNGKRLLVLKDSFCLVVAPFLSLGYDTVDYIDLRLYGENLMEYIDATRPDAVIVLYNPGALEGNNRCMFEFLPGNS